MHRSDEDPVDSSAADRRRRLYDAGDQSAEAGLPGCAADLSRRSRRRRRSSRATRTSTTSSWHGGHVGWRASPMTSRSAWQLRRRRFDVVIDLHGGPRSSWLAFATGAPQRIGYDIQGRSWMYTRTVAPPARVEAAPFRGEPMGSARGASTDGPGRRPTRCRTPSKCSLDPAADARIARRLDEAGIGSDDEVVVIHVSASNPFRRWPEPAFARAGRGPGGREHRTADHPELGPVGSSCRRAHRRSRA